MTARGFCPSISVVVKARILFYNQILQLPSVNIYSWFCFRKKSIIVLLQQFIIVYWIINLIRVINFIWIWLFIFRPIKKNLSSPDLRSCGLKWWFTAEWSLNNLISIITFFLAYMIWRLKLDPLEENMMENLPCVFQYIFSDFLLKWWK